MKIDNTALLDNIRQAVKASAVARIGLPYIYGGSGGKATDFNKYGLDCSELIIKIFSNARLLPLKKDYTADGLHTLLINNNIAHKLEQDEALADIKHRPHPVGLCHQGNLIQKFFQRLLGIHYMYGEASQERPLCLDQLFFYGNDDRMYHVALRWNDTYLLEAGGGSSKTLTRADAVTRPNAQVRFVRVNQRIKELKSILQIDYLKFKTWAKKYRL